MPSKSRKGFSKNEVKRAQAAKAKAAPKMSSRAVASKAPVATGPAVGPLMTGQIRSNTGPAVGPLLTGQTRKEDTRSMASKAKAKKSSGLSGGQGLTFGAPSGGTTTDFRGTLGNGLESKSVGPVDTIKAGGGGIFDRLLNKGVGMMGALGQRSYQNGVGQAAPTTFMSGTDRQNNINDIFGVKTASADDGMSGLGRALRTASEPDLPTGYGDNGETFFNGNDRMSPLASDFGTGTNFSRPGSEFAYNQGQESRPSNPFGIPTANASEMNYSPVSQRDTRNYSNQNDTADSAQSRYEDLYNIPQAPTQEEITQQQNELYGGGPGPVDQAPGRVTNQLRGSGQFGTGKGVGNPAGDDPYLKELRKAYSSNGGEKWLRKQFDELIKALDPTYAQMQTEGTNALNENLRNNSNQLASVMNAGNVGDSEQRTQQLAGLQQSNQTALGQLLAKLAQGKASDASGYRSQMAEGMGKLQERNQTNQQRLQEQIQQYKNNQWDREYKMSELNQKGGSGSEKNDSLTFMGNNAQGEPVFWNNRTKQNQVGGGLTRPSNSMNPQLQQDPTTGEWGYYVDEY